MNNIDFDNLKRKLLQTNIFIDNEYLNEYANLIISNIDTSYESYKYNLHHIIPRYYFISNGLDVDNSENNLVNLLYKDHIKSHYFLALCSKSNDDISKNILSIRYILHGKSLQDFNIDDIDLDLYLKAYECSKQFLADLDHQYESNLCISNKLKGRTSPNKGLKKLINRSRSKLTSGVKNEKLSVLASQRVGERNSFFNKHHSLHTKDIISDKNSKSVAMIDRSNNLILMTFKSMTLASKYLVENKIAVSLASAKAISAVCKGKARHAYGFKWKFIDKV